MPVTPRGIVSPNDPDNWDLIVDLATMATSTDAAIGNSASGQNGTAAQRTAYTASAPNGFLWQDTDGAKLIWRKDGAVWVPAVWRWSGTGAQMSAFAAPNGFEWFNTTDGLEYTRISGAWIAKRTAWTLVLTAGPPGAIQSQYRINDGYVEMRGVGTKPAGTTMFTLPVGLRPMSTLNFHDDATPINAGPANIQITAAGAVNHSNAASAWVGFDIVRFAI